MAIDLEKIHDSPHLLEILLQMEDVLDSLDVYVFKNWLSGEIIEGPKVKRFWLDFTLRYDYKKMPDPKGALRLLKHGIQVKYKEAREEDDPNVPSKKDDKHKNKVWLLEISMPRRLVSEIAATEMDYYDEEVDMEDVEDAKDSGIGNETEFEDENNKQNDEFNPDEQDQNQNQDQEGDEQRNG